MELDRSFYLRFAELCREVATGLVALESDRAAGRIDDAAAVERLFRVAHDLAGQAGMLERRRVSRVAALTADRLRSGPAIPSETWPRLNECLARLLEAAAADATGGDVSSELEAISRDLAALL